MVKTNMIEINLTITEDLYKLILLKKRVDDFQDYLDVDSYINLLIQQAIFSHNVDKGALS